VSPPPMRTCVARASLTRARTTVSPASVCDHIPGRPYPGTPALLAPVLRGHPPALPAPVRGCCLAAWSYYNFLCTCVCNRICFSLSETVSVIKRSRLVSVYMRRLYIDSYTTKNVHYSVVTRDRYTRPASIHLGTLPSPLGGILDLNECKRRIHEDLLDHPRARPPLQL
jgi:hypothetical protein